MFLPIHFKILHVFLAVWFISGLIGWWIALSQAAASRQIHTMFALVQLAGCFERLMVIPGSLAVFLLGILTGIVQGTPVLGFLQGGHAQWLLVSILLFLSVIPLIPGIFLPKGKIFEQALQDALSQGQVTSRLMEAFHDRIVFAAHVYELFAVAAIVFLMVAKPI